MKKILLICALALTTTLAPINASKAGMATGGGSIVTALCYVGTGAWLVGATSRKHEKIASQVFLMSWLVAFVLDSESGKVKLSALSIEDANRLGINEVERLSYNENRDEIELVTNEINSLHNLDLNDLEFEESSTELRNEIPSSALSALNKIIQSSSDL